MKFLVLALCVCAASAASIFDQKAYKPQTYQQQQGKAVIQAPVTSVFTSAPVVASDAAYAAAQVIAGAPVAAAKAAFTATKDYYSGKEAEAAIVRSDTQVDPNGFNYYYETDNKIAAQATGTLKRVGEDDILVVQGSFRYIGVDGKEYLVTYIADENGFQPQAAHLPVGPEIPEDIARSIEYLRANAKPEPTKY